MEGEVLMEADSLFLRDIKQNPTEFGGVSGRASMNEACLDTNTDGQIHNLTGGSDRS